MKTIKSLSVFMFFIAIMNPQTTNAQEDEAAVKAAITDYMEALYNVEPFKIERSVDPNLRKIGYWFNPEENTYRDNLEMTYQQLYDLAGSWNKDGSRVDADSPREIKIYEVHNKTATAKLTAEWGIDMFQLAKVDGQWKIYNIIWQSHPE